MYVRSLTNFIQSYDQANCCLIHCSKRLVLTMIVIRNRLMAKKNLSAANSSSYSVHCPVKPHGTFIASLTMTTPWSQESPAV